MVKNYRSTDLFRCFSGQDTPQWWGKLLPRHWHSIKHSHSQKTLPSSPWPNATLSMFLQKIHPYYRKFHLRGPLWLQHPLFVRAKDNPGSIFPFAKMRSSMLGSTLSLRFRKSISGQHFQIARKFANNDFQYQMLFIVCSNTFLQKKWCFSSCKKFHIDLWSFLVAK